MVHVKVERGFWKKVRLPVDREGLETIAKRATFAADAAPVIFERSREEQAKQSGAAAEPHPITFHDFGCSGRTESSTMSTRTT